MGKRGAIISVILLVLGLAVLGYYIQQGRKRILTDPFKAISPAACVIIETVDLQSFLNSLTTGKGLFGEVAKIKEIENFNSRLKFLADQLNKPGYKKLFDGGTALISFFPSRDGKLNSLLSLTVPGDLRFRNIKDVLHSSGVKEVIETKSGGTSILNIPYELNNSKDTVFISLVSGLIVCSGSKELTEDAIIQVTRGEDIRKMPGFARVHMTSGKNEDKIFVVFANLRDLLKKIVSADKQDLAVKVTRLAGTLGGDIYINETGVVLSGYTESPDSTEYLHRYKFLQPREFHTYKILPSATVFFETLVFPNRGTF